MPVGSSRMHAHRSDLLLLLAAVLPAACGLAAPTLPSPKAVVSIELDGILWDSVGVRNSVRSELQD